MLRRLISHRNCKAPPLSSAQRESLLNSVPASKPISFPAKPGYDLDSLRPQVVQELQNIVGTENVLTEEADLIAYSIDGTWIERRPLAVVLPSNTNEVSAILRLANRELLVAAPRGSASGLSGGSVPLGGDIALSMTRMNRILEIDQVNLVAVVEPGVITATLQTEVEKLGLFYPPDPSSLNVSAIGGNVAENAGEHVV